MNVLSALSISRSVTRALATGCSMACRNCLVNDGAPASVLGYSSPRASNIFCTEAADQGSTLTPDSLPIQSDISLARLRSSLFACSALSRSTLTPRIRISITAGRTLCSSVRTDIRLCSSSMGLRRSQSLSVSTASASA